MSDVVKIRAEGSGLYVMGYFAGRQEADQLRFLLWLHHGHSGVALYGDDGELQCHACPLDFRNASIGVISEKLLAGGRQPA